MQLNPRKFFHFWVKPTKDSYKLIIMRGVFVW